MIHSFGNNRKCIVKADLKFLFDMPNIPLEICPYETLQEGYIEPIY